MTITKNTDNVPANPASPSQPEVSGTSCGDKIQTNIIEDILARLFPSSEQIAPSEINPLQVQKMQLNNLIDEQLSALNNGQAQQIQSSPIKSLFNYHSLELDEDRVKALNQLSSLVDHLFDFVDQDKKLHQEIKEQLVKLRLIFFKLAINEPDLFTLPSHPARQLLNLLANTGLLWNPTDPPMQIIYSQIDLTISEICRNASTSQLVPLFNAEKSRFEQFVNGLTKRTQIFEKRIKEAEEGKAKAEVARQWALASLNSITNKQKIPDFIQKMFQHAWKHVLFLEYIKNHSDEDYNPTSSPALYTAKALLVSLKPVLSSFELEKFLQLQKELNAMLQNGLEKSSYSFDESKEFFSRINDIHQKILSEAQTKLTSQPEEEILRLKPADIQFSELPVSLDVQTQTQVTIEKNIEDMSIAEWVETVFEKIPDIKNITSESEQRNRLDKDPPLASKDPQLNRFKPGDWFDLTLRDHTNRCKLSTHIAQSEKYVFVNSSGTKIAEFNETEFSTALSSGRMEPLESQPLFDRAYQSTIDSLTEDLRAKRLENKEKQSNLIDEELPLPDSHNKSEQNASEAQKQEVEIASTLAKKENNISEPTLSQSPRQETESTTLSPTTNSISDKNQLSRVDLSNLCVGSWIEFKQGKSYKRCRLAAKINSTGKLIFTDRNGIKIKEFFTNELEKLYLQGQLKIDQENDLFNQALASVISNMRGLKSER